MLFYSVINACLGNRGLALLQQDSNRIRAIASRIAWPVASHRNLRNRSRNFKRVLSTEKVIETTSMPVINSKIEVSDLEQQIFDELLEVVYAEDLKTTLRCAGGWVRDKLMGKMSLDIDIALDNMLGREFAERVNQHLKLKGAETHHVAVIASNPEQSKHLETARMKIRGHWIDLVNLRSEEYAQNSRIPSMKFGTPEQDALRRDFTINALFYNINSRSVEDFTGRGLTDLCKGIIRTPLAPKETFLDDPLRVLRAVRFSARFGFTLEESLLLAASDDDVREALGHKVSRERIGAELDGMLKGPNPVGAVRLLRTLRLFEAVFEVHPSANSDVVEEFASVGTALLTAVYDVMHHAEWAKDNQDCSPEAKRLTLLAALLLPLRKAKVNSGVKGKPQSMATHIIKDSLKWRGKDSENVDTLHAVAPRLLTILGLLTRGDESLETAATGPDANKEEVQRQIRVQLGQCLRELKKELWLPGIVIASVLPMIECDQHSHLEVDAQTSGLVRVMHENEDDGSIDKLATIPMPNLFTPAQMGVTSKTLEAQVDACSVLIKASRDFELVGCWDWKPLLDGKAVMAAVGMSKGGPALGHVMEQVMGWQLANPRASREDCKIWLKEHGADILQNFEESILKPK